VGLGRRTPRQVGAQGRAGQEQEERLREDRADDEDRLAEDFRLCGRAGAAAEVYAQVAMLVLMATIAQRVRRVDGATHDERAGGDEGHQAIATESLAQQMRDPVT
jgi:hypothetical protein